MITGKHNTNAKQFSLNESDIIHFIHIPKTAGVTLTRLLDNYFDYDKILKPEIWKDLLYGYPEDISKFRFIRGHFGYGMRKILPKNTFNITLLREPIDRTLSNFDHYIRTNYPDKADSFSKNKIIERVLSKSLIKRGYQNMQTLYTGLDFDAKKLVENFKEQDGRVFVTSPVYLSEVIEEQQMLNNAKRNLEEFAFVGITERFEESMQLLCYTFGWKPFRDIKKFNVAKNRLRSEDLTNKVYDIVREANKLDLELYDFAKKLFNKRYQAMLDFLSASYKENTSVSPEDSVYDLLEQHYQKTFWQDKPKMEKISYDFSQALMGDGWYNRETGIDKTSMVRWSGPSTTSTIDLPPLTKGRIEFKMVIENHNTKEIFDSLRIKINDKEVSIEDITNRYKSIVNSIIRKNMFSRIIKADVENYESRSFTKIFIKVNKTARPEKNPKDTRKLGIKVSKILLESTTQ